MQVAPASTTDIELMLTEYQISEANKDYKKALAFENLIKYQFVYYFDNFTLDFILEKLERLGYNPALLTDNDGQWSINIQEMEVGNDSFNYPFPISWSKSIKEAVKDFIDEVVKSSIQDLHP